MNPIAPVQSFVLRAALFALGGLLGLVRRARAAGEPSSAPVVEPARFEPAAAAEPRPDTWLGQLLSASTLVDPVTLRPVRPRQRPARRIGAAVSLTVLFTLGAALSAAAGDQVAGFTDDPSPAALDATITEEAEADVDGAPVPPPADPIAPEEGSVPEPPATPVDDAPADDEIARPAPSPEPNAVPPPAGDDLAPPDAGVPDADDAVVRRAPRAVAQSEAPPAPRRQAVRRRAAAPPLVRPIRRPKPARGLEVESPVPSAATIWLHRLLPDPTPPSRRLTRGFARQLTATARARHVDWALLLGILRARGELGSVPASRAELRSLADAVSRARAEGAPAVLAVTGSTTAADTAIALAHLHRAVGMAALVRGLEWAKPRLGARLLHDRRVEIYEGGRADVAAGRIDVRVLALVAYLADTYGGVTISSLESGHRLYSRPGVISAHIYGLAADISAVGRTAVYGSQEPGGTTEALVRSILLLPVELRPAQVISLLGLGGPSFPLADHDDHVHVGF